MPAVLRHFLFYSNEGDPWGVALMMSVSSSKTPPQSVDDPRSELTSPKHLANHSHSHSQGYRPNSHSHS